MKRVVFNADDFGFTRDVNAGIIEAHRNGVLRSTTLMATGRALDNALRLARENPTLDVGCHLVLVQGCSLLTRRPFPETPRDLIKALVRNQIDVYTELRAQIEALVAARVRITHLDSHKHTHIIPSVFRRVVQLAHEFAIPYVRLPIDRTVPLARVAALFAEPAYLRTAHRRSVHTTDHFLGFRLTGRLTEQSLSAALARLPNGTTEFMCHPGLLGPELASAETRLKDSRVRELEALTSPRIRELLEQRQIEVCSFATL